MAKARKRALPVEHGDGAGHHDEHADHHDPAANRPDTEIPHAVYCALGQYIADANPYTQRRHDGAGDPEPYPDPTTVNFMLPHTEKQAYAGQWEFGGAPRRVSKAMRIAYCVRDKDGQILTKHILIGYEGGNGW